MDSRNVGVGSVNAPIPMRPSPVAPSQHSEEPSSSVEEVLEKHGYSRGGPRAYTKGQPKLYTHNSGKHGIRVHGNRWEHETLFQGTHSSGEGHETLDKHLTRYHNH